MNARYDDASKALQKRLEEFSGTLIGYEHLLPLTMTEMVHRYMDEHDMNHPPSTWSRSYLFVRVATIGELRSQVRGNWQWDRIDRPAYPQIDCRGRKEYHWKNEYQFPPDPTHNYGIDENARYACCGRPLDHPGCWMGKEKYKLVLYDMAPGFGEKVWPLVRQRKWDKVEELWLVAPQQGTMWLFFDKHKEWHNQIVEGKIGLVDAIVSVLKKEYELRTHQSQSKIDPLGRMEALDRLSLLRLLGIQATYNKIQCVSNDYDLFRTDLADEELKDLLPIDFFPDALSETFQEEINYANQLIQSLDFNNQGSIEQNLQAYILHLRDLQNLKILIESIQYLKDLPEYAPLQEFLDGKKGNLEFRNAVLEALKRDEDMDKWVFEYPQNLFELQVELSRTIPQDSTRYRLFGRPDFAEIVDFEKALAEEFQIKQNRVNQIVAEMQSWFWQPMNPSDISDMFDQIVKSENTWTERIELMKKIEDTFEMAKQTFAKITKEQYDNMLYIRNNYFENQAIIRLTTQFFEALEKGETDQANDIFEETRKELQDDVNVQLQKFQSTQRIIVSDNFEQVILLMRTTLSENTWSFVYDSKTSVRDNVVRFCEQSKSYMCTKYQFFKLVQYNGPNVQRCISEFKKYLQEIHGMPEKDAMIYSPKNFLDALQEYEDHWYVKDQNISLLEFAHQKQNVQEEILWYLQITDGVDGIEDVKNEIDGMTEDGLVKYLKTSDTFQQLLIRVDFGYKELRDALNDVNTPEEEILNLINQFPSAQRSELLTLKELSMDRNEFYFVVAESLVFGNDFEEARSYLLERFLDEFRQAVEDGNDLTVLLAQYPKFMGDDDDISFKSPRELLIELEKELGQYEPVFRLGKDVTYQDTLDDIENMKPEYPNLQDDFEEYEGIIRDMMNPPVSIQILRSNPAFNEEIVEFDELNNPATLGFDYRIDFSNVYIEDYKDLMRAKELLNLFEDLEDFALRWEKMQNVNAIDESELPDDSLIRKALKYPELETAVMEAYKLSILDPDDEEWQEELHIKLNAIILIEYDENYVFGENMNVELRKKLADNVRKALMENDVFFDAFEKYEEESKLKAGELAFRRQIMKNARQMDWQEAKRDVNPEIYDKLLYAKNASNAKLLYLFIQEAQKVEQIKITKKDWDALRQAIPQRGVFSTPLEELTRAIEEKNTQLAEKLLNGMGNLTRILPGIKDVLDEDATLINLMEGASQTQNDYFVTLIEIVATDDQKIYPEIKI